MDRFIHSKIEEEAIYQIYRACRLCGAGAGYKMPIIQNFVDLDDVPLTQKIRECVQIEVHQDDKMPPLICELCVDKVNDFYEYSEMCKQTNMRTRLRLGLPPQTLPRGAPNAGDCILGVTEPIYVNEDSNEPLIKNKQGKLQKSKIKKEPPVTVKIEALENRRNSRSNKAQEDSRRSTRGSVTSPTNVLSPRNKSFKDLKALEQPMKKALEPLKSILKKEKTIKDEDSSSKSTSKRGRDRDTRSDLPVKRVKIEATVSRSHRSSRSPPRSKKIKSESPEPFYVCQMCKRRFASNISLRNHMRAHSTSDKNLKNKRNAVELSRPYRDRVRERSHAKGKGELKLRLLGDITCSICGRECSNRSNLRRHEVACSKRKKEVSIDPELMSKLRPLQVRVARCDPLLGTQYTCSASEIPQMFGLDKNCFYPYISRTIKTEPKTGRDGMVRIEDAIEDVIDEANFIHWDSDSSDISESDVYETFSKRKKVMSLSTISLKTIFSSRYLGRARRKRRKTTNEDLPKVNNYKEISNTIDSFDDIHDLERMNDTSFDQLFAKDYSQMLTDTTDMTEDDSNKEEMSNKENGSTKDQMDEHKDLSESDNRLSKFNVGDLNELDTISKDTTYNKVSDVSEDVASARDSTVDEDKEITGDTNLLINTKAESDSIEKNEANKESGDKINQIKNNSVMDLKEIKQKSDLSQSNIENEGISCNIEEKLVSGDTDKSNNTNSTQANNNDKEIEELKDNPLNKHVHVFKEDTESVELLKEEKMEVEEKQTKSGVDLDLEEESIQKAESPEDLIKSESMSSFPTDDAELVNEGSKEEKELMNCVSNIEECSASELITESDLFGADGVLKDPDLSRDSMDFNEKFPVLDKKEEYRKSFNTEIGRDSVFSEGSTVSSLTENQRKYTIRDEMHSRNYSFNGHQNQKSESSQLLEDRVFAQEVPLDFNDKIERNKDILKNNKLQTNYCIKIEENGQMRESQEFNQNDSTTEDSADMDANKDEFGANAADDIMRAVLNKVEDTKKKLEENSEDTQVDYITNLNGQKKYKLNESEMKLELEDQILMDELDAQIGEDLMPKKINLDDFSEDF